METHQYWTEIGKDKTFTTPFDPTLFAAHVPPDARVLDYGCGYGRAMALLAEKGFTNLKGVDFSKTLVERGRRECPGLDLRITDGATIPFPDNSFDAALLLGVLTCITDDEAQAALIAELNRVLAPGGVVMIYDFLLNDDKRNLDRYHEGMETHGTYGVFEVSDGGVLRHHSLKHVNDLLAPFETLHFREDEFITMHGNRSRGYECLVRKP